jgi:hypothetical protein
MKTIFKYPIKTKTSQLLLIPKGFQILVVKNQFNSIVIWALVDTENQNEEIEIEVHGTGNPIYEIESTKREYLGTAFCDGLVWHVFHRIN